MAFAVGEEITGILVFQIFIPTKYNTCVPDCVLDATEKGSQ